MDEKLRILLLEDSPDDVVLLQHLLRKSELLFDCRVVERKTTYARELLDFRPNVVISDHALPQFDSMEALKLFKDYQKDHYPPAVFILVTGTVSEEFAVKAIQSGADDYILKDRLKRLPSALVNALERSRLKEQQRRSNEENLHLLDILHKSLHEIYVVNPHTLHFDYTNDMALENLGYSEEEIKAKTPVDIIRDFDIIRLKKALQNVRRSKKGKIYEGVAIRKDGSQYPIQMHLQYIQQGNTEKFLANVLDITETKNIEKQKQLVSFIQDSFDENKSLKESLQLVLERFCGFSGIPAAEIWMSDFEEADMQLFSSWTLSGEPVSTTGKFFAEKAYTSGKKISENELQKKEFLEDGRIIVEKNYAGTAAYPIKSGDEVTAVLVVLVKEIEQDRNIFLNLGEGVQDKLSSNIKRKKTEEELQKIFELSPDVLAVVGKDGFVKKANPSLRNILGYSEEFLLNTIIEDLVHPDDQCIIQEWKSTHLQDGEVGYYDCRFLARNGSYRWFSWSVTPFLKEEFAFAVGKDITESKEQIEAIQAQNRRLAEIAWEQSHVVRAPLSRLLSCVHYLEGHDATNKEILESIKSSALELDDIVKSIVKKTERIWENERDVLLNSGR